MDFARYFDKKPLTAYAYGPSGSGVTQPQPFTVEWTGSFDPNVGVSLSGHSGHYFLAETSFPTATEFSFCFDGQSNVWLAYGSDSQINLSFVSGSSRTNYTISGTSPGLFNNSILQTGVNEAFCFYLKGDAKIYFKKSTDNFAAEYVLYSGNKTIKRIEQVAKLPEFYYRFGVYHIDSDGDGRKLISDKFLPMTTSFFNDFEAEPTGTVANVAGWMVEGVYPSGYFDSGGPIIGDGFETTPTGNINSLTSGNNMLPGYFI